MGSPNKVFEVLLKTGVEILSTLPIESQSKLCSLPMKTSNQLNSLGDRPDVEIMPTSPSGTAEALSLSKLLIPLL